MSVFEKAKLAQNCTRQKFIALEGWVQRDILWIFSKLRMVQYSMRVQPRKSTMEYYGRTTSPGHNCLHDSKSSMDIYLFFDLLHKKTTHNTI